jgi:hypothetical protein
MARVQIRQGNLFDGPSDLIVLPCNTEGGITLFVSRYLEHFKIPSPKESFALGEVEILPLVGAEQIAQYVAFAASVSAMTNSSTQSAIKRIGFHLGTATIHRDSIKEIAAPLLGTGAGGLSSETALSNLRDGFLENAAYDAKLTISILDQATFEHLKTMFHQIPIVENRSEISSLGEDVSPKREHLRVFLSYTNIDSEHKKWVESLATFLRQNGINARVDFWHLRHGMDLPQWMANELQLAEKVIIISDERYKQKADGRHGGVGWETMIIQGDMAIQPPDSTKYLVIVCTDKFEEGIPFYLKTKYAIHWNKSNDEFKLRQELLRELYDISQEPPIGERPIFV